MREDPVNNEGFAKQTWKCCQEAIKAKHFQTTDADQDWEKFCRAQEIFAEAIAPGCLDVAFCASVNFNLFAASVSRLGTEKHQHVIDGANKGEVLGCFALTELKHGVMS